MRVAVVMKRKLQLNHLQDQDVNHVCWNTYSEWSLQQDKKVAWFISGDGVQVLLTPTHDLEQLCLPVTVFGVVTLYLFPKSN